MKPEQQITPEGEQFSLTMVPVKKTRKRRTSVFFQFFRFIALNIKMLIIVRKSH